MPLPARSRSRRAAVAAGREGEGGEGKTKQRLLCPLAGKINETDRETHSPLLSSLLKHMPQMFAFDDVFPLLAALSILPVFAVKFTASALTPFDLRDPANLRPAPGLRL